MTKTILCSLIMFVSLKIIALFIPPTNISSVIGSLGMCLLYAIIGASIYLFLAFRTGLINKVFNFDVWARVKQYLNKFKRKNLQINL